MPQTRISETAHQTLRRIAAETGKTSEEILDEALDRLERERLLDAINRGYAALPADRDGWAAERAERELWDHALGDGLE